MPQSRITYSTDRACEVVEPDRVRIRPPSGQVLLHKTISVAGQPREVVVRRLSGAEVRSIEVARDARPAVDARIKYVVVGEPQTPLKSRGRADADPGEGVPRPRSGRV